MPLDPSQNVYSPPPGYPVESDWGIESSEHVLQRFASIADRDLKWPDAPHGAHCVCLDSDTFYYHDATPGPAGWKGISWYGLCTYQDLLDACPSGLCTYGNLANACLP